MNFLKQQTVGKTSKLAGANGRDRFGAISPRFRDMHHLCKLESDLELPKQEVYPGKLTWLPKMIGFLNVPPASNMAILGIHVSFRGCIAFLHGGDLV